MNEMVTYSIVNNEMSSIKDIIEYHSTWVDGLYVLDTGSTDGTLEYLRKAEKVNPKLKVEEYSEKFIPRYELDWESVPNPFPEVQVRNYALKQAEKLFNPKWIIQLDGDEVFLSQTKDIIRQNDHALCIGCSTLNPVNNVDEMPIEYRGGYSLYDPHIRIWRANSKVVHIKNPAFNGGEIHCIPTIEGNTHHLFHHPLVKFVNDPLHFHLHWLYGRKLELFYNKLGITDRQQVVKNRPTNQYYDLLPFIFQQKRQKWEQNIVD